MKKSIFVISDLHLGGAPAQDGTPSFQMCSPAGQTRLAEFIRYVADQRSPSSDVHLLINGDIVDFLAEKEFAAFTAQEAVAGRKLSSILERTAEVWKSLEAFVGAGCRLTLLLGNHDIELSLPTPRRILLERLGPGRVEFIYDNQAFVEGSVLIEHGNRYDSWNVISHDQLREVRSAMSRGEAAPLFESPAGSRLVINIMNKIKAKFPFVDLLKPEDAGLLPLLAVLDPSSFGEAKKAITLWRQQSHVEFDERGVPIDVQNIASGTSNKDEELIDLANTLYTEQLGDISVVDDLKNVFELWQLARSTKDKEAQLKKLYVALRARAESTWQTFDVNRETQQFIKPAQAAAERGFKVIVFGHTHLVKRVSLGTQGGMYLNSGTWADLMQVPNAVLEGNEAEGKQALVRFVEDLRTNQLEQWRRLVPTFIQIDFDGASMQSADAYFFDGAGRVERVSDGRLTRLARDNQVTLEAAMANEMYETMKAACARVVAGTSKGTGYLVGRDRVITCAHVVKMVGEGGKVTLTFATAELEATVTKIEESSDAAVLTLANPFDDVTPLSIAGGVDRKASWEGYGFPELTRGEGLPLEGAVMDPDSKDDQKAPVLLLRSEQIAAGEGASLHGFSGSPVLVSGMVVGHLKRYIKDKESPLRPAYGYVYATPSSAVLQLLGAKTGVPVVRPPAPLFPTTSLPNVGEDEYHVFVSYRSTDRKWVDQLVSRLEGVGFKVFIDHRELIPGTQLVNSLQKALARCKSAVVIMSSGWLESPWCQEEANVLLKGTIENPSFHVVPVLIDKSKPPVMWDGRLWLDLSDTTLPEGPELRRLQFALLGKTPPREDATENQVFKAETAATDDVIREIRAAAAADPERVYVLWKKWREAEMPDGPANLHIAQSLISLARPDQALEVLKHAQQGDRANQLRSLALAKTDNIDEAIQLLKNLYDRTKTETDSETGGILAGRYKQRWKKGGCTNNADLRAALEIYRETFERTKDSYPGINAAAMALELGDRSEMLRLAQQVLLSLQGARVEDLDHWNLATFGEAYLLLSDLDNAKKWYGKAVAYCPECHQDIAVMRGQARRNLEKLGFERSALDGVLDVPRVAAFTGHMVDAPGRATPRFPADKVGVVRKAIAQCLKKHEIGYGFSSAARGSDLIFIEELKNISGRPRVFLPFPREQFKKTSVGYGWDERFDKALRELEVVELSQELPPEDKQPEAYAGCNRTLLEEAIAKAKLLDEEPLLITVWNGNPGDGAGGTADAVREWRNEGHPLEIIDISKL